MFASVYVCVGERARGPKRKRARVRNRGRERKRERLRKATE